MEKVLLSVSDFVALTNQTLEYAYPNVAVQGEVTEFKVSQGKWVYFKIKDEESVVDCFMTLWQLRVPIENGMMVIVQGSPKLTKWGRFSLTIKTIRPSGEGAIKKSFELLRAKLDEEGLFAPERKRRLPTYVKRVGVISSTEAAGYGDFMKIVNDRWGGVEYIVAHTQVQGESAPDQMIRALAHLNGLEEPPEVIVIIRGGGSADDLAAFNDEQLVRAIAASRVPTLVGVGHEVDQSLADLAADVRAATPSNAAQLLVPDRRAVVESIRSQTRSIVPIVLQTIDASVAGLKRLLVDAIERVERHALSISDGLESQRQVLRQLDPQTVLARGYALIRGTQTVGAAIEVETQNVILEAEVKNVRKK